MRVRLLTYNIHRAIGLDRRYRPERIVDIVSHHHPDVVLLQEVDEGAPRSREMDMAHWLCQQLGYPYMAIGHNVTLRQGRYGNATLSRWPLIQHSNLDLTIGEKKRRGCLYTTIEAPGPGASKTPLHLFNMHLGLSARERIRQLGKLTRHPELRDLRNDETCIMAGDFNDWRSQLEPILVEFLGFRCATRRVRGPLRTYPSFSPTGGLDRIYLRGPIYSRGARGCRLKISRVASDHLPVVADLDLRH